MFSTNELRCYLNGIEEIQTYKYLFAIISKTALQSLSTEDCFLSLHPYEKRDTRLNQQRSNASVDGGILYHPRRRFP